MQFVVIGNGIAGVSAAYTVRRLNKEAAITIISKEAHPAYSACSLPNYISNEISRERVFIREPADYLREDVHLITSEEVVSLDIERREVILHSETVPYDKLIIAAGSRPVIPHIKGTEKHGVFTFKSLEDADRIYRWDGQAVVVVGSGPIGVEICLALKKRGYRVFLIELLDWILPHVFDEYPASIIEDMLQRGGIEVSTQERVIEFLGRSSVEEVATESRQIKCDTVVIATGMRPETGLVTGMLKLGSLGGIMVDDKMGTSIPGIYGCGDCVEAKNLISGHPVLSLLWHNAKHQGEVAGSNAAGVSQSFPGSLDITGVDILGNHAVSIGSTATTVEDGLEVIERRKDSCYQRLILSNQVLVGAQSINWSENMGLLLTAIIRKEKVKKSKDLFSWRKPLLSSLRCFPFGRKLTCS